MAPEMFSLLHPYSLQRLCDQSSPSHATKGILHPSHDSPVGQASSPGHSAHVWVSEYGGCWYGFCCSGTWNHLTHRRLWEKWKRHSSKDPEKDGWKCACVEAHGDTVVSLYQTLTSIPGGGAVLFGGRTSPLNPTGNVVWVTFDPGNEQSQSAVQLSFKNMVCTRTGPKPRWRHTSTLICYKDKTFLFVFGGVQRRIQF